MAVTTAGLNYLLDAFFTGGTQIKTWYIGLCSTIHSMASTDSMASHPGWQEFTDYAQPLRATLATSPLLDFTNDNFRNASGKKGGLRTDAHNLQFHASDFGTYSGAFLTSAATKGGTTGTLFSVGRLVSAVGSVTGTPVADSSGGRYAWVFPGTRILMDFEIGLGGPNSGT